LTTFSPLSLEFLVGICEGLDVGGTIILKWIFKKWDMAAWRGLMWLRIGMGGRELVNAVMNFGFA